MDLNNFKQTGKITYVYISSKDYCGYIEVPFSYNDFKTLSQAQRMAVCQAQILKYGIIVNVPFNVDEDSFYSTSGLNKKLDGLQILAEKYHISLDKLGFSNSVTLEDIANGYLKLFNIQCDGSNYSFEENDMAFAYRMMLPHKNDCENSEVKYVNKCTIFQGVLEELVNFVQNEMPDSPKLCDYYTLLEECKILVKIPYSNPKMAKLKDVIEVLVNENCNKSLVEKYNLKELTNFILKWSEEILVLHKCSCLNDLLQILYLIELNMMDKSEDRIHIDKLYDSVLIKYYKKYFKEYFIQLIVSYDFKFKEAIVDIVKRNYSFDERKEMQELVKKHLSCSLLKLPDSINFLEIEEESSKEKGVKIPRFSPECIEHFKNKTEED